MDHRFNRWRSFAGALLLLTFFVVAVGCAQAVQYPQSTLHPKGDFAQMVDKLFRTTLFWATLGSVWGSGCTRRCRVWPW